MKRSKQFSFGDHFINSVALSLDYISILWGEGQSWDLGKHAYSKRTLRTFLL